MKCEDCAHWVQSRVTRYEDGSEIETYSAPGGKGHCDILEIDTPPEFGCISFLDGDHVKATAKAGAPYQYFTMIPCPDCNGKGDGGRGHRCAGTGLVRLYDDGYIGDEQTRLHPAEKPDAPKPAPTIICLSAGKGGVLSGGST